MNRFAFDRPELFRLLNDCRQNDILLIEDVDRLSRLTGEDWNSLKKLIRQKDIRVMAYQRTDELDCFSEP